MLTRKKRAAALTYWQNTASTATVARLLLASSTATHTHAHSHTFRFCPHSTPSRLAHGAGWGVGGDCMPQDENEKREGYERSEDGKMAERFSLPLCLHRRPYMYMMKCTGKPGVVRSEHLQLCHQQSQILPISKS